MPLLRHIPQIELFRETEALGLAPQVPEGEGVKGVDRQSLRAKRSRRTMRSCISIAAFRVKVTARIRRGSTPCRTRCTKRTAKVVVLPAPGPAKVS
jgi:hypothetical protein